MILRAATLCRLLGHAWHREAAEYYCIYDCTRCGHHGYDDGSVRERISHQLWRIGYRFSIKVWHPLRSWLRCKYCGLRFGRHDETIDHLPF